MITNNEITLVHDSLTQYGGAERLVKVFCEQYSGSPLYCLVKDKNFPLFIKQEQLHTSKLQLLYNFFPHFQFLFPFIPFFLKLEKPLKSKVVLSSSSAYGKAWPISEKTVHINYCHTPTRFLWTDENYALKEIPKILRPLATIYFKWLKKWDVRASQNVDIFIANSKEVQNRIEKYYNRESEVVYPFIDTDFWKISRPKSNYFLVAGRLQPYKGIEMVISVFNKLKLPLHVVGTGRHESYLKSIARPNITFYGRVDDNELRDQYSGAKALIYPQLEDFGLMPLEAACCQTPTIAINKGGTVETIINAQTGILLDEMSPENLIETISNFDTVKFDYELMVERAKAFNKQKFIDEIDRIVNIALNQQKI